jgi:hypothetical protein
VNASLTTASMPPFDKNILPLTKGIPSAGHEPGAG